MSFYVIKQNNKYKCLKNNTKYYKYSYQQFVQPTLTSNGTSIDDMWVVPYYGRFDDTIIFTQGGENLYRAFIQNSSNFITVRGTTEDFYDSGGIEIHFKNPIKISNLSFMLASSNSCRLDLYGANDDLGLNQIGTIASASSISNTKKTIECSDGYYYDYLYLRTNAYVDTGIYLMNFSNILTEGEQKILRPATVNDYDVIDDTNKYYMIRR